MRSPPSRNIMTVMGSASSVASGLADGSYRAKARQTPRQREADRNREDEALSFHAAEGRGEELCRGARRGMPPGQPDRQRVERAGERAALLAARLDHRHHEPTVREGIGRQDDGERQGHRQHGTPRQHGERWIGGAQHPFIETEKPHRRQPEQPRLRPRTSRDRVDRGAIQHRQKSEAQCQQSDGEDL